MKVISDKKAGTWTLCPVGPDEEKAINAVIASTKKDQKLKYIGRGKDDEEDKFCVVHFNFGGEKNEKLTVCGTTKDDKYGVNNIRNTCFFGSGGLVFIKETTVDGKPAIVVTALYCKSCGSPIIGMRAEWKICDKCADECDHKYVEGPIHGPRMDVGTGEFCKICGRVKPEEKT